jgi:hypothetical protein
VRSAGPIVPLVASSVGTYQLLSGPGSRPAAVDALAARTLVEGEPLTPPAGRGDDFAWPRSRTRTDEGRDTVGIHVAGESGSRTQRTAEAEKVATYQAAPTN